MAKRARIERRVQRFPPADKVGAFGPAFLRLMFAYAQLERRVSALQDIITGEAGFGEKNQWKTWERPKRMRKLIRLNRERLGVPQEDIERVANALKRAITPCDLRNLLAHGTWWELAQDKQAMKVRREKLQPDQEQHVTVKVHEIDDATSKLRDIEKELSQFQTPIEDRLTDWTPLEDGET
jgi:hypothetical protein